MLLRDVGHQHNDSVANILSRQHDESAINNMYAENTVRTSDITDFELLAFLVVLVASDDDSINSYTPKSNAVRHQPLEHRKQAPVA